MTPRKPHDSSTRCCSRTRAQVCIEDTHDGSSSRAQVRRAGDHACSAARCRSQEHREPQGLASRTPGCQARQVARPTRDAAQDTAPHRRWHSNTRPGRAPGLLHHYTIPNTIPTVAARVAKISRRRHDNLGAPILPQPVAHAGAEMPVAEALLETATRLIRTKILTP